jgi:multiple sugar transport system ATP-binding protein
MDSPLVQSRAERQPNQKNTMSNLSLKNIKKSYDGKNSVIEGLNLEIHDGEFMVFVGPSGCGKTTLLRMIAGLEDITDGEIYFGEEYVNDIEPAKRGAAMVFQSYALYPHMTVSENLSFSLKMAGASKAERLVAVEQAAEILQIKDLLDRKPKALSGGQRQRVAIGRAIVRKPKVFLFDEPLSNLDANLRVQMRIELSRLHRELATTMIYVTHDQVEAMTLGQRIAVFNKGRIEQVGTPLEVYQHPANTFVAEFMGSPKMNLMPVTKITQASGVADVSVGNAGSLRLGVDTVATAGIKTVGVRPEHFAISTTANGLAAQVGLVEHLGDCTIVYAKLAGVNDEIAIRLTGLVNTISNGQTIHLTCEPQFIRLFDDAGRAVAV